MYKKILIKDLKENKTVRSILMTIDYFVRCVNPFLVFTFNSQWKRLVLQSCIWSLK